MFERWSTRRFKSRRRLLFSVSLAVVALLSGIAGTSAASAGANLNGSGGPEADANPPPPPREPIQVNSLPLPPTAPTAADGSVIPSGCTNPTGCMSAADTGIEEGPSYTWDGEHVVLPVVFAGSPDGSPYAGTQVVPHVWHPTLKPDGSERPARPSPAVPRRQAGAGRDQRPRLRRPCGDRRILHARSEAHLPVAVERDGRRFRRWGFDA